MTLGKAALAVPGDLKTRTGGYIYDARLLDELRAQGRDVAHLALPGGFPVPDDAAMAGALAQLQAVPEDRPVIIDGLALGALEPEGVARIRAPIVALIHHPLALETGLSPEQAAHFARVEAANLARAAHVMVPSPHTAEVLVRDYGVPEARLTVARPGIDQPDAPPAPSAPPLILSVGVLAPRKGHDVLLRALAQLTDLEWNAVIVGKAHDDTTWPELASLRGELLLSGRVNFEGELSRDALAERYRAASIFALATRYEGYGMVFSEALVHGLPIVSCRAGAVPDTVPEEAGLLVPVDDPEAFAAALRGLLDDPAQRARLAEAARRHGAALPGWADTAALFGAVLDAL